MRSLIDLPPELLELICRESDSAQATARTGAVSRVFKSPAGRVLKSPTTKVGVQKDLANYLSEHVGPKASPMQPEKERKSNAVPQGALSPSCIPKPG